MQAGPYSSETLFEGVEEGLSHLGVVMRHVFVKEQHAKCIVDGSALEKMNGMRHQFEWVINLRSLASSQGPYCRMAVSVVQWKCDMIVHRAHAC